VDGGPLRAYAMNLWITGLVSSLVWTRGEMLVVRLGLSLQDVGLYTAALGIAGLAGMAMNLLTGALMPRFAQLEAEGRHEESRALCRTVTDVLLVTGSAGVALLALWSGFAIDVVYGSEYSSVAPLLSWLALSALALSGNALNGLLQLRSEGRFTRNLNLVSMFVLFALALPLVNAFGLAGAVAARVGVQWGMLAWMLFASSRVSAVLVDWRNVGASVVIVLLACGVSPYLDPGSRVLCSMALLPLALLAFRIGVDRRGVLRWGALQWAGLGRRASEGRR
jgi:O-antigen/teichoic acid export membrane protein